MSGINWNMGARNGFVEALDAGLRMGEAAREASNRREMRKAVAAFAANPDDPAALQEVMAHNPELGMKLADYGDKRAFNSAMGEYLAPGGQPNALLGMGAQPRGMPATPQSRPQGNALAATAMQPMAPQAPGNALSGPLPAVQPGASFNEAFAPVAGATPPVAGADGMGGNREAAFAPQAPANDTGQPQEPDLSFLGEPQTGRDRAFLKMVQRDPVKALKIQSTLRDNFMDRLADERDFYELAIDQLSSAQDEAAWQAGLQRLAPMAQALGGDLFAHVPRNHPGPEGVQALLEKALPVKERLDYLMRAANMDADNERADRNTDSLIDNRDARLTEQRRATDERIATTRRGQDLTDNRVRSGAGRGGGKARLPEVSSPAEAMKLPSGTKFRIKGTKQVKVRP